jgi:hypothetical protein
MQNVTALSGQGDNAVQIWTGGALVDLNCYWLRVDTATGTAYIATGTGAVAPGLTDKAAFMPGAVQARIHAAAKLARAGGTVTAGPLCPTSFEKADVITGWKPLRTA